jgi:hypothetical protein
MVEIKPVHLRGRLPQLARNMPSPLVGQHCTHQVDRRYDNRKSCPKQIDHDHASDNNVWKSGCADIIKCETGHITRFGTLRWLLAVPQRYYTVK